MSYKNTAAASGFGPILRTSPLLDALGGFMSRDSSGELEIALMVGANHVNAREQLHGGAIATLADCGMGYILAYRTDPPMRMVTVSMTIDYVGPAFVGDLVRVIIDSSDRTGRLIFASGRLLKEDVVVARIRGLYSLSASESRPPTNDP